MANLKIEVIKILEAGKCNFGHKKGDLFEYPEEKGKICSAAWHTMYPYLSGLQYGASYPWEKDADVPSICNIFCLSFKVQSPPLYHFLLV